MQVARHDHTHAIDVVALQHGAVVREDLGIWVRFLRCCGRRFGSRGHGDEFCALRLVDGRGMMLSPGPKAYKAISNGFG